MRNEALRALQSCGVRLASITGDLEIGRDQLDRVIDTGALDKEAPFTADVIVLCCKAWQAEGCLKMCEPYAGTDTVVLPLQNGASRAQYVRTQTYSATTFD